jgi:hypothetical protein
MHTSSVYKARWMGPKSSSKGCTRLAHTYLVLSLCPRERWLVRAGAPDFHEAQRKTAPVFPQPRSMGGTALGGGAACNGD